MSHCLSTLYRFGCQYGVGVALLLTTSMVGNVCAEPFPTTLQDYVTLYEIKSYQHCQHDSKAFQERLAKSKEVLKRMKKHKGKSARKSAEAAAKQWFIAAVATPASLPATPAFEYLKDTDRSSIAKTEAAKKTEPQAKPAAEPADDQWQDRGYSEFAGTDAETTRQSEWKLEDEIAESETPAEFDWNTTEPSDGDALASIEPTEPEDLDSSNEDQASSQAVASAVDALKSAAAGVGTLSDSGAAAASSVLDSAANSAVSAKQSMQGLAAKVWGESDDDAPEVEMADKPQEPFAEMEGIASEQGGTFDDFAQVENELADATAHWASNGDDINTKITEFNDELSTVRSDMRVAFGGDGSQLETIVSQIEGLTESRSGLQAMIDLSANRTNHKPIGNLVSLMDEFRQSMKDLKLIMENAEIDKAITIEESEALLQRVEDIAPQAEALR